MARDSKRAPQLQARYDWDAHATTRERNAKQIDAVPGPKFPATGTSRISALLAEASGVGSVAHQLGRREKS
ncbi:MAG: hypothetical protein R2695_14910 [Acidimicrobiales bacterium]